MCGSSGLVREAAELAHMCGTWPDGHVLRVRGMDDRAVWVWCNVEGDLRCLGVAPWGDTWDCDAVDAASFFARLPPDTWLTKSRAKLTRTDWTKNASAKARALVWDGVEWCVGMIPVDGKPRARRALLCRVAHVENGVVVSVITEKGGPVVPAAGIGATRWIPQSDHVKGYERMFDEGVTDSGSYMWHVIYAAAAAGTPLKRKRKAKGDDAG